MVHNIHRETRLVSQLHQDIYCTREKRKLAQRVERSKDARPQLGRFTAQCEYVIWGTAGAMPANPSGEAIPGFYKCVAPRDRVHVTQKPLPLMRELLRIVPPGATVLDTFMGSGITGVACIQTGRRFVGIELDPVHFESVCERISEAARQGALFDLAHVRANRHG